MNYKHLALLCQQYLSDDSDDWENIAASIWREMDSGLRDVLKQLLFQGPVGDGNVVSKAARDDLIDLGLATRCCFLGEQGYTAATYAAYTVFKEGGGIPYAKKPGSPG